MRILIQFLEFLEPYGTHSYFVMFAVLIACGFGLPMPEDVVLITGGMMSAPPREITNFWHVVWVCMAGVLVGDGTIFMLGRHFGSAIKRKGFFRRLLSEKNDKRVANIFAKYGDKVIFMARFMPGLRTPIFLTAGIYRVSPWKFFMLDGLAAIISVPLWIYVGYYFGENLDVLERRIREFQYGIYGVLALLIVFFVVGALVKRRIMGQVGGGASALDAPPDDSAVR